MLHKLFKQNSEPQQYATILYQAIVATARQPQFYREYQVPDTPLGRYEMLSLVTSLVLYRLKYPIGADKSYDLDEISQEIVDSLIVDLDACIREITKEDLKVGQRIKKMAQGFYGRLISLNDALSSDDKAAVTAMLKRNAYGFSEDIDQIAADLAGQVLSMHKKLATRPLKAILKEKSLI